MPKQCMKTKSHENGQELSSLGVTSGSAGEVDKGAKHRTKATLKQSYRVDGKSFWAISATRGCQYQHPIVNVNNNKLVC